MPAAAPPLDPKEALRHIKTLALAAQVSSDMDMIHEHVRMIVMLWTWRCRDGGGRTAMGIKAALIAAVVLLPSVASAASENSVYTLYRNSMLKDILRVHVATFDADSGEAYNQENCMLAAALFMHQPGVKTKFWCERGRFKP